MPTHYPPLRDCKCQQELKLFKQNYTQFFLFCVSFLTSHLFLLLWNNWKITKEQPTCLTSCVLHSAPSQCEGSLLTQRKDSLSFSWYQPKSRYIPQFLKPVNKLQNWPWKSEAMAMLAGMNDLRLNCTCTGLRDKHVVICYLVTCSCCVLRAECPVNV